MRYLLRIGSGAAVVLGLFTGSTYAQSNDLAELQDRIDELEARADEMDEGLSDVQSGTNKFNISGYGYAQYVDKDGSNSNFDARFNPIFSWKLSDQLFTSAELEVELDTANGSTVVNLEYAELDYIFNDWLTFRAGKLLSPLSTFKEQLHPAWINKSIDQPLFATGGARLIPTSGLGIEARGAFPVGTDGSKLTYSIWMENGPNLTTTGTKTGQLGFSNWSDNNDNKSIGARIGFFPLPELEIAYAILVGEVDSSTPGTPGSNLDTTVYDLSFAYVVEDESIGGRIDLRGEYVHSEVDPFAYGVAPVFSNEREAGYLQFAYRPTMSSGNIKNVEFVVRYDTIQNPSAATVGKAYDETRWTIGLNYWLSPSAVMKIGYQFDDINDPMSATNTGNDAFLAQYAIGF